MTKPIQNPIAAGTMWRRLLFGLMVIWVLAACSGEPTPIAPSPAISTDTVPPPTPTPLPDPRTVTEAYLSAWQAGDYAAMYARLASESRAALSAEDFENQYRLNLDTMTVNTFSAEIADLSEAGDTAQAAIKLNYETVLVGALETEILLPLRRESDGWRVVFSPALIWPELVNGQQLLMATLLPERGAIYDRNGVPLVAKTDAYAVGLIPAELGEGGDGVVGVSRLLGIPVELINRRLELALPDQYLPLGEASAEIVDGPYAYLFNIPGVYLIPYTDRYYYGSGAAAHVTGYTTFIQANELAEYRARGYTGSERVGRTGLEAWAEEYLAGKVGGQLQLRDANNQFIRMVAATESRPAQDVYATIDFDLQQAAQFALGDLVGGIVVMDYHTGEVLALASSPTFSPNLFSPFNRNAEFVQAIINDPRTPLLNHAAQATYPAGSVFKIVTMSAALTSGRFTPETLYNCTGEWNETSDPFFVRKDWREGGHGEITLVEGLSGSCNPWFYHIGFDLFNWNPNWLSQTARAFGLGQRTNIGQIEEDPGLIPDPEWKQQTRGEAWSAVDAINMSIGQGDVLVTPLQIARLVAAVANGGTLLQPQLVQEIRAGEEPPVFTFQAIVSGTLPLEPEQLEALQTGMVNVMKEPLGTARNRFRGFRICVAGKTGTAENPGLFGEQDPDAWFAGYTCANRPDKPDIAIAVVVARTGQGSDYAAPIFRRVVEAYYGLPYTRYPWEESIGVPRREETPTPEPVPLESTPEAETPTPSP